MVKEGYWVTRTYRAGNVWEKSKHFVPGTRPTCKDRRAQRAAIRKQEQNEYSAQKALARLLNANFTSRDFLLGLDYSAKGMLGLMKWLEGKGVDLEALDEDQERECVWASAEHALELCLRRVKYRLKKEGRELKAVYITSDMDGSTGDRVRIHHHLVINADARDAFVAAWQELGSVDWTRLYDHQEDRTPIAEYMISQVRRIPDAKKFRSTRNLVRPKPEDRIAQSDAELRLPKGAKLQFRAAYGKGQPQYIRFVMPQQRPMPGGGTGEVCPGEVRRE
jgi:hypothetical protein